MENMQAHTHTTPSIDPVATQASPWRAGDVVAVVSDQYLDKNLSVDIERRFLGVTPQGYCLVQDFYKDTGEKFTDPYVLIWQVDVESMCDSYLLAIDGALTSWHRNGQKRGAGQYGAKGRQGLWTFWHDNGQKEAEGILHNGKRQGVWKSWHPNGQKEYEGAWQDDNKTGLWTYWHDNV